MNHDCYTYNEILAHIKNYALEDIKQRISENLKRLRKGKGWKMRQVAAMIPLSLGAYQKYEEKLAEPSIGTLKRLGEIYGITVDEIIQQTIKI